MKNIFYWFVFADGHRECTRGFSKRELAIEERIHGKLIAKIPA